MKSLCFAVTGANGYVGKQIVTSLRESGYVVYELARSIDRVKDSTYFIPFSLRETKLPNLSHIDVLIHCAYDFSTHSMQESEKINLNGSIQLLKHAQSSGVKKLIVLSTLSSFIGTRSVYGKTKLAIEQSAQKMGAIILRPGLIFGRQTVGIVGAMKKFVKKFPIIPLIGSGKQPFYACYIDDLCQLIHSVMISDTIFSKPIFCATKKPVTFKELVIMLAKSENKTVMLLPIPFRAIWLGLKFTESIRLPIGLRSDSIVGAYFYDKNFNMSDFTVLEFIHFRSMNSNLL